MQQYDLYFNTDSDTKKAYPFFVDIQNDLLDILKSRVVIPLTEAKNEKNLPDNLCPCVEINGKTYYLLTHQITTVPFGFLNKHAGSLLVHRTDILNSIDFLISGI